jgi:hypothetical protein
MIVYGQRILAATSVIYPIRYLTALKTGTATRVARYAFRRHDLVSIWDDVSPQVVA